jgi:MerR family transcriptional regulator, light-induced transcriptional regulator
MKTALRKGGTSAGPQHPMAVVARRTGLSPDVIRAWERRHRAVEPARTHGNQRLYSDRDVERLVLIRQALEAGWQIGHVASLRDEKIRALLGKEGAHPPTAVNLPDSTRRSPDDLLALCLQDIARLDATLLQCHLDEAAVEMGRIDMLDKLLVPLFHQVGDECSSGKLRIASEHLASAVVGRFLESLQAASPIGDGAPALIVTTPAFQQHQLGALLVAATARMEGWRTTYLGPNLPAEEIAAAARMRQAKAVALSIAHPGSDPSLSAELERLGRQLRGIAEIIVGGSAARTYQVVLDSIGARCLDDLAGLRAHLKAAR